MDVAAGVVAFVAIAGQLVESVRKLHVLVGSIEDAPKQITCMKEDLAVLLNVLEHVCSNQAQYESQVVMQNAIVVCKQRVDSLAGMMKPWTLGFASSSKVRHKWTALKVAFKDDKIREASAMLEAAKSTLILALQSLHLRIQHIRSERDQQYLVAINQASGPSSTFSLARSSTETSHPTPNALEDCMPDAISEAVQNACTWISPMLQRKLIQEIEGAMRNSANGGNVHDTQPRSLTTMSRWRPSARRTRMFIDSSMTETSTVFGTIYCQRCTYRTPYPYTQPITDEDDLIELPGFIEQELEIYLVPSWWLSRCMSGHRIKTAFTASAGATWWQKMFSVTRLVPDDAPIFTFCKTGDLNEVRKLLQTGKASVNDTNSRGKTPLHVAASALNADICALLLGAGADRLVTDCYSAGNLTPFQRACWSAYRYKGESAKRHFANLRIPTLRAFIDAGEDLDAQESISDWGCLHSLAMTSSGTHLDESDCSSLLSWLLKQFIPFAEANPDEYNSSWWEKLLRDIWYFGRFGHHTEAIAIVLDRCDIPDIRRRMIDFVLGLGFFYRNVRIIVRSFQLMVRSLGGLHFVVYNPRWGGALTPTAAALKHPLYFHRFRALLRELSVDMAQFVREEIAVLNTISGKRWTAETLMALFVHDCSFCSPEFFGDEHCKDCYLLLFREPARLLCRQHMDIIQEGGDPNGPYTEEELRRQREWEAIADYNRQYALCSYCQRKREMEQVAEEQDRVDDTSPFLLDLEQLGLGSGSVSSDSDSDS